MDEEQEAFYRFLLSICDSKGLPVTHESPFKLAYAMGHARQIENFEYNGIFFSLGHLRKKSFITNPGFIINAHIPRPMLQKVRWGMPYDGFDEFMSDHERLGTHVGLEVVLFADNLQEHYFDEIISNIDGSRMWPNPDIEGHS
jgi:hypothetical protein